MGGRPAAPRPSSVGQNAPTLCYTDGVPKRRLNKGLLETGRQLYLTRNCRTLREVAEHLDVGYSSLREAAGKAKWREQRREREEKLRAQAAEQLRATRSADMESATDGAMKLVRLSIQGNLFALRDPSHKHNPTELNLYCKALLLLQGVEEPDTDKVELPADIAPEVVARQYLQALEGLGG